VQLVHFAFLFSLGVCFLARFIIFVSEFPKTANNKLDRNALPNPGTLDYIDPPNKVDDDPEAPVIINVINTEAPQKILAEHVCNVVERVRGSRPNTNATFASIGVNSLGAIMFIKQLSESLGGLRLQPRDLYSPGVTIQSLSGALFGRLLREKPQVLTSFGIDIQVSPSSVSEMDLQASNCVAVSDAAAEYESFEDNMLANRKVLDGVRGMLILMVLWDHMHGDRKSKASAAMGSDTELFIILSGFTTALQTRPVRERDSQARPWNWRMFRLTRAIGVFPLLWLALLLSAGSWYYNDAHALRHFHLRHRDQAVCASLYVVGEQSWYRRKCSILGPNDVLYASLIWNCFLLYALFRVVFESLQRQVRVPLSATYDVTLTWPNTWHNVRAVLTSRLDNRPCREVCYAMIMVWMGFFLLFFYVIHFIRNKVSFASIALYRAVLC
jgi:OpgC protein/Phosphopantetheine attachment site